MIRFARSRRRLLLLLVGRMRLVGELFTAAGCRSVVRRPAPARRRRRRLVVKGERMATRCSRRRFLFGLELAVPPLLDRVGHLPPAEAQRLPDAHLDEGGPRGVVAFDEVQVLEEGGVVAAGPADVLEDDRPDGVVFLPDAVPVLFGEFDGGRGGRL